MAVGVGGAIVGDGDAMGWGDPTTDGVAVGWVDDGLADGVLEVLADGVLDGVTDGVTRGVADGVGTATAVPAPRKTAPLTARVAREAVRT
ncbi:hypothetical protein GCM10028815_21240 [Mariniluteicoccus flavus]